MKRETLIAATVALFAASTAVYAADPSGGANSSGVNTGNSGQTQNTAGKQEGNTKANAPEGFVLIEENTVFLMGSEPEQHLMRAFEQLQANNPKAAAAELRLTGAYLKMQEARPGNPSKDAFSGCEERLNELAARLHKGEVKGPELAKAAALVNYDLAKFYSERATSEIGDQHKQVQGGYDLQGAADAFEQALIWNSTSGEVQANASSQGNGQQAQTNGKSAQATAQQPPAQGHQPLQQQDARAISDARIAADRLIAANDMASGQNGGAQPAASKSGPSNEPAKTASGATAGNAAQASDPHQAATELKKQIDNSSSAFKSDTGGEKASSSSK